MKAVQYSLLLSLCIVLLRTPADAQTGAFNPSLLACGRHGEVEIICGTVAPEDFERTPDSRFLIVSKMGRGENRGLDLFNLATQTFTAIPLSADKEPGWGEDACKELIGGHIQPHGLSLSKRTSGEWQLYVVNHNTRESMEMYELLPDGTKWKLVWRGSCSRVSRTMTSRLFPMEVSQLRGLKPFRRRRGIFSGANLRKCGGLDSRGWRTSASRFGVRLSEWILVSEDGRSAYINGWVTRDLHKYDLATKGSCKIRTYLHAGQPNLEAGWQNLAAGIKGINGNCPPESNNPCIQGFVLAQVDPKTMESRILYDNNGKALINGAPSP